MCKITVTHGLPAPSSPSLVIRTSHVLPVVCVIRFYIWTKNCQSQFFSEGGLGGGGLKMFQFFRLSELRILCIDILRIIKFNVVLCFVLFSVLFEMQSFGPSLIRLMSTATGRYLSMRRDGSLRGLVSEVLIHFTRLTMQMAYFIFF